MRCLPTSASDVDGIESSRDSQVTPRIGRVPLDLSDRLHGFVFPTAIASETHQTGDDGVRAIDATSTELVAPVSGTR